ncbi:peptidase [Anaerococcus vaginalis]|uniref:peptidase n=1 Tax=Anaerococcus vaginalis TaxID=33037 RepID=UPI002912C2B4|nr:peptidase [Anaerococcus vaginalis]MDU5373287.1 peptidase [Anaerococcus vaginalis]
MNKNKKIISASLALALGVSLLIPNAKANEEKSVENALKEPVKTSETAKIEEKSAVLTEKTTINKAPVNNGTEKPADGEEIPTGDKEEPKDETEKPKDEKKVKPKEFKMSEIFNENTFEFIKNDTIKALNEPLDIYTNEEIEEFKRKANLVREAKSIDEIIKITGWKKEQLAKNYLLHKGIISYEEYHSDLIKIIDDTMTSNQKNPNRKNKKTGTTNTANTVNTGKKVNNAGENVQTGVGSLSAILGLLGASSLGLFKSKRK